MTIVPVLMAGGIGSRLWPLSRAGYPKQFLSLTSEQSMLQETMGRINHPSFEKTAVICNEEHRFLVAEHIRQTGTEPGSIILEAEGRGTAFTIAVGALSAQAQDPDALILVLPCDHVIEDASVLHRAVEEASAAAQEGRLVVFGVKPRSAYTGYGYIKVAAGGQAVSDVEQFTEKPDQNTAEEYLNSGNYLWNAGIFLFSAKQILKEIEDLAPDVYSAAVKSWEGVQPDLDFQRLPEAAIKDCPSISIDYAVLEKSENVSVVRLETGWSDLGSWQSVWQEFPKDDQGNVVCGDVVTSETQNSLIYGNEKLTVAAHGIEDLAIIADEDAVLVTPLDRAEEVSGIVANLGQQGSRKHVEHLQIFRPWGNYKILDGGPGYLLKRLTINPGGAVSLQYHNHRAEHWVVVKGEITVVRHEEEHILKANESIYIPIGAVHRISNEGAESAELIEVQTGDILEEEDIVRLEDKYQRDKKVSSG